MGGRDRPLKILHIDPERDWGGGETQVLGLVKYLSLRGQQNHLLCHPEGALLKGAQRVGIRTLPLRMRNDLDWRPLLRLRRLIRRERYDIIHFHTRRAHALAVGLNRDPGIRYVVTRRMDYPVRRNWYNRWIYNQRVSGVVAISEKIADLLVQGGVKQEKVRVIHSGIEPLRFQMRRSGKETSDWPVVGTVAVLEKRKGHRYLFEAARILKGQGFCFRYHLAGVGSQRSALEELVRCWGLQEEVTFFGFVSEIPEFLSRIDLFVLPSLYEGLGVAVLESMAAAKPVVASRIGGLPELVEDRVNGLLVPPGDSSALAQAISQVFSVGESLREQMGTKGRERVLQRFTMEVMARKNEEFYYELLGIRKPERL